MNKTIKEMAVETFPDMVNYNSHCKNLCKRDGFIVGAKTVLEEIEKVLKQAKLYSDLSCKSRLYDDLVNLVEQLKK